MGFALRFILLFTFSVFLPLSGRPATQMGAAKYGLYALIPHLDVKKSQELKATGPLLNKRKFKAKGTEVYAAQVCPQLIFRHFSSNYSHAPHCSVVFLSTDYSYHKRGPPVHV